MELVRSAAQLTDRRVLIMGLGTKDGGVGATLFAVDQGADVTVTDRQEARFLGDSLRQLDGLPVRLRLGRHDPADFLDAQIILRNPGIRRDHPLLELGRSHGAIVDSPIGLFFEAFDQPLIGITGTKGKSFTTHLVQHILTHAGHAAVAAGNNCVSPLRHLGAPVVVVELSSWQLHELGLHRVSPSVACWLNFFPDHLDHYAVLESYWEDKRMITAHQGAGDRIVLPWGDPRLRRIPTRAQKVFFSLEAAEQISDGCVARCDDRIVLRTAGREQTVSRIANLPPALRVPHHFELALAATACASAFGVSADSIGPALVTFPGIPHRFEPIADWRGIRFVNDSAATTPQSVMRALAAVERRPTILIFGGGGQKGLSYDSLATEVARKTTRVITFADDGPSESLVRQLPASVATTEVPDMEQAVRAGSRLLLDTGGTLLPSPGCSGAPFFPDLFVRGELFRRCVEEHTAGRPVR